MAALVLIVIHFDPTSPEANADANLVLISYLAFAAAIVMAVQAGLVSPALLVTTYIVDLGTIAFLMSFTEGAPSPFFFFFTFILLASALRWNWHGAIFTLTALLVLLSLLTFGGEPHVDDVSRFVLRGAYLLVAGAMIAYFGASRLRSRARFAKLAAWPTMEFTSDRRLALDGSIAHAAGVLNVSRMLCIWEHAKEPGQYFCYWENGHSEYTHETVASSIRELIAPEPTVAVFMNHRRYLTLRSPWGSEKSCPISIIPYVREKFRIGKAVMAPFENGTCKGFLFALDCNACDDLLPLTTIVATRLGAEIEHHWLSQNLQMIAAEHERSRWARNVHDGVLQALTATALNLKVCAQRADANTREELDLIRNVLAQEQKRVRELVSNAPPKNSRSLDLATSGNRLVAELGAYWHCEIPLQVKPVGAKVPADVAGQLHLILAEAVANAARHGRAKRVAINLERCAEALHIQIVDNGKGFPGLSGTYDDKALGALQKRPRSICERVAEMHGHVTLSTSSAGSQLRIQLPVQ